MLNILVLLSILLSCEGEEKKTSTTVLHMFINTPELSCVFVCLDINLSRLMKEAACYLKKSSFCKMTPKLHVYLEVEQDWEIHNDIYGKNNP